MFPTVEGVYRDGKVELLQVPPHVKTTRVLVTFLAAEGSVDLQERGITKEQAAEMRWRFGAGAADWDSPEMDVYNDY